MDRLTRAEHQRRTRAKVLDAARAEFGDRGYRDAKIDAIAERAGLTRGGVYSNFPGKRALYFAVLADDADRRPAFEAEPGRTAREALSVFGRAWLTRLPLVYDLDRSPACLGIDLLPEIAADERLRFPFGQLLRLDALLLGLALEHLHPAAGRRVGVAEAVLAHLHGVAQLAAAAPWFFDEFRAVAVCERLAGLELEGDWAPPHLELIPRARPADEPWPAPEVHDAVRGATVRAGDGVLAVLGVRRLGAVEEAVRAAPPGTPITLAVVTGAPEELADLARLALTDAIACLRPAFPESAWPSLRVVHDPDGALAAAAGVASVSDDTESAVRITGGRIVARAEGFGACHAAATA